MNYGKIANIIQQCTEEMRSDSIEWGVRKETVFDKRKFAELLIRRCAEAARHSGPDGDLAAFSILYEFDIDSTRSK